MENTTLFKINEINLKPNVNQAKLDKYREAHWIGREERENAELSLLKNYDTGQQQA